MSYTHWVDRDYILLDKFWPLCDLGGSRCSQRELAELMNEEAKQQIPPNLRVYNARTLHGYRIQHERREAARKLARREADRASPCTPAPKSRTDQLAPLLDLRDLPTQEERQQQPARFKDTPLFLEPWGANGPLDDNVWYPRDKQSQLCQKELQERNDLRERWEWHDRRKGEEGSMNTRRRS